ncbi:MAG: DNA-processing protein DprA [Elusimicrobiota bacterium]
MSDRLLRLEDPGYPEVLREVADAPSLLHVRGVLPPSAGAVAIVGSRKATPYGRRMARRLAEGCARAGVPVVSGLARGVDTEAHLAALDAGGTTWAVLGCGLDVAYPPENAALAERIVRSGGALLSEFPPGTPPLAAHFPRRNRIISALACAVVVVEGDLRSGSLITARIALAQGREVFAVPGPADSPLSAGPLELLRQGAALARGYEDLAEELPELLPAPASTVDSGPACAAQLSADEGKIIELLASSSMTVEELAAGTGWPTPRLLGVLTELEGRDLVLAMAGQRYARY